MRRILALLFLCVTLHLSDGKFYSLPHEQHEGHEVEPHSYRQDWSQARGTYKLTGPRSQADQDFFAGNTGPVTVLGRALLDTVLILLEETPTPRSTEGQRRSNFSDLDFRDSSGSPGSSKEVIYILPGYLSNDAAVSGMMYSKVYQDNNKIKSNEKCFVRQVLDLIYLLMKNAFDDDIRKYQQSPKSGPKLLHLLVNELSENLESMDGIETLDNALFKFCKIARLLLRGLKAELAAKYKNSAEMDSVVKFLTKLETYFGNFVEANREMAAAGTGAPAIRLILDRVEEGLEELAEGVNSTNGVESGLSEVRKFVAELRTVLEVLLWGKLGGESKISPLTHLLSSLKSVLKLAIEEKKFFTKEPGSLNNLILALLVEIYKRLGIFLGESDNKPLT